MGYVWSTDSAGLWAGIKLLSHTGTFNHYAIDNYAANGGLDLSDGFSDAEKATSLTTSRADAGVLQAATGNDVISSVSNIGGNLAANAMKDFILKNRKKIVIILAVTLLDIVFGFDPKFTIINLVWLFV